MGERVFVMPVTDAAIESNAANPAYWEGALDGVSERGHPPTEIELRRIFDDMRLDIDGIDRPFSEWSVDTDGVSFRSPDDTVFEVARKIAMLCGPQFVMCDDNGTPALVTGESDPLVLARTVWPG